MGDLLATLSQDVSSFETLAADESRVCGDLEAEIRKTSFERAQASAAEDILASGVFQAVLYDRSLLKENLRHYEAALALATEEMCRFKASWNSVDDISVETVKNRSAETKRQLEDEWMAHEALHRQNAILMATHEELVSNVRATLLNCRQDVGLEALADALLTENECLRRMVEIAQSASKSSACPATATLSMRNTRPSIGSRSARSSDESSPAPSSPMPDQVKRISSPSQQANWRPASPVTNICVPDLLVDEEDLSRVTELSPHPEVFVATASSSYFDFSPSPANAILGLRGDPPANNEGDSRNGEGRGIT